MNKDLIILVDYKGFFGSKYNAAPYNSGMSLEKIEILFKNQGFNCEILNFCKIDYDKENYKNKYILYTSSEDHRLFYKDFIEDVIYGLELNGAIPIPKYKYLRANNNKVFMEILKSQSVNPECKTIKTQPFGTLDELKEALAKSSFDYPVVIKPAAGAMSRGVQMARNIKELIKHTKKTSRTRNYYKEFWEIGRSIKYPEYIKESKYRKKFIIQEFKSNIDFDWKVLVFNNKYYALKRMNRKNDFRASGGGLLEYNLNLPDGLLDFAESVFKSLKVPHLSLDVGFDGVQFHLFEFQVLYFGTYTLTFSDFYFSKNNGMWTIIHKPSELEVEYVNSIVEFIHNDPQ